MNQEIILNRLSDIIAFIKKLDDKRGNYPKQSEAEQFVYFLNFNAADAERDFNNAKFLIEYKFGSLRLFIDGFSEYMNSNLSQYEKNDLASRVIQCLEECDNFLCCHWSKTTEYLPMVEYFDEKSGYDEDFREEDGEVYWCLPNLEDYLQINDEDEIINTFYKYSYYIILIAQKVAEAVNKHIPAHELTVEEQEERRERKKIDARKMRANKASEWISNILQDHLSLESINTLSLYVVEYIVECRSPQNIAPIYDIGSLDYKDIYAVSHYLHHNFITKNQPQDISKEDWSRATIELFRSIFKCLETQSEESIYRKWKNKAQLASYVRVYRE